MLLLSAYMDETGHSQDPNQRFVGMASLIAPAQNWMLLETEWRKVLHEFRVPYFHMREFAHSVGVFASFKNDEPRRREIFRRLLDIINAASPLPMGWIVPLDVYRNLSEENRKTFGEPYYRALLHCMFLSAPLHVANQSSEEIAKERIALVFSDQVEFKNKALRYFDTAREMYSIFQRVNNPSFDDMRRLVPLQAADILAYELNGEYERRLYKPQATPRYGYQRLHQMANKVTPYGVGEKIPFAFVTEEDVKGYVES